MLLKMLFIIVCMAVIGVIVAMISEDTMSGLGFGGFIGIFLGIFILSISYLNMVTTQERIIDLNQTDFTCEVEENSYGKAFKTIHINNQSFSITSIEFSSSDGLYIQPYKSKTWFNDCYYSNKLIIGNCTDNEKINLLLKSYVISMHEIEQNNIEITQTKSDKNQKNLIEQNNENSVFCTECGTKIDKNYQFCSGCGIELFFD